MFCYKLESGLLNEHKVQPQNEIHIHRKGFDRSSTQSLGGLNNELKIATKYQAEFNRVSYCQQYETNQLKNKEQGILQKLICSQFHPPAKSTPGGALKGPYRETDFLTYLFQ